MKVLILCPYPFNLAPSQRFRFEQYLSLLNEKGIELDQKPFIDQKGWNLLYKRGGFLPKSWAIIKGFIRRIVLVFFSLKGYDLVFIHREAAPIGPPFFEWWITKIAKKRIVYDFDDAIWLPNTSVENRIVAGLKWHGKVGSICEWAWKVSCGNEYLADFARMFNKDVMVNPTTIDLDFHIPRKYSDSKDPGQNQNNKKLVIGWTGTHSTAAYLDLFQPIWNALQESFDVELLLISNKPPGVKFTNTKFQEWRGSTEIADLQQIDIGIMPMGDDDWSKGKCGLKALQFMALEIPVVASPVGMNEDIIQDGSNGFLATTTEEWINKLIRLINDPELRKRMGKTGRETVLKRYSVQANKDNFLSIFSEN